MTQRSIHDNRVYGYEVVRDEGSEHEHTITIFTAYKFWDAYDYTDITFAHVVAHHIADTLMRAVLFRVEEASVSDFLDAEREDFVRLQPAGQITVPIADEDLAGYRQDQDLRAFSIVSSYGIVAWVFARRSAITPRAQRKVFAP